VLGRLSKPSDHIDYSQPAYNFFFWGEQTESIIRLFRRELFSAFFEWLEVNKEYLGKWYSDLYNRGKDAEAESTNAIYITFPLSR